MNSVSSKQSSSLPKVSFLDLTVEKGGTLVIEFNRPEKKNSLFPEVFRELCQTLKWAELQQEIKVIVLTGKGQFYSSGIELSLLPETKTVQERELLLKECHTKVYYAKEFIDVLIQCPKILIAAVNGPVLGIACTTLALFDFVFASDDAFFMVPFTDVALCAEGCSSVLFPKIIGPMRANEMLLLGKKFISQEMHQFGFVNQVFPKADVLQKSLSAASHLSKYSHATLQDTKRLVKEHVRTKLLKTNEQEFKVLFEKLTSEEHANAVKKFYR